MKVLSYKRRLTVTAESDGGGKFDISFNDLDKEYYPCVLDLASNNLRRCGLFITENVLWPGQVRKRMTETKTPAQSRNFNQRLYAMKDFFTSIVPLRDGLAVAVKA
jgi:caffeoyl-CoA O-methyltransferase